MPQEFHVLRCFKCQTFQVHQVKKSNKWSCKLCGSKQSVIKVYGRGSGYDCRQHVQKLNMLRAEEGDFRQPVHGESWDQDNADREDDVGDMADEDGNCFEDLHQGANKWSRFVEDGPMAGQLSSEEEEIFTTDKNRFDGFRKQSRKRKRQEAAKQKEFAGEDHHTMFRSRYNKNATVEPTRGTFYNNSDDFPEENATRPYTSQSSNLLTFKKNIDTRKSTSDSDFRKNIPTNNRIYSPIKTQSFNKEFVQNDVTTPQVKNGDTVQKPDSKVATKTEKVATNSKWGQFIDDDNQSSSDQSENDDTADFNQNVNDKSQPYENNLYLHHPCDNSQSDENNLYLHDCGYNSQSSSQDIQSNSETENYHKFFHGNVKKLNIGFRPALATFTNHETEFSSGNSHLNQETYSVSSDGKSHLMFPNKGIDFMKTKQTQKGDNFEKVTSTHNSLFTVGDLNDDELDLEI